MEARFARGYVVPLLHGGMLGSNVEVAHTALQRRAFIDCAGSRQREARIGDTNAGSRNPYSCLRALREMRLVIERPASAYRQESATWIW